MERSPATSEHGEAAFPEAAGGAAQRVVDLVVRSEDLTVTGLVDRALDSLTCTATVGVGEGRPVELRGRPVQRAQSTSVAGDSGGVACRWPGAASDTQTVRARDSLDVPSNARCFPECQELQVLPFTLVVVAAHRPLRRTFSAEHDPLLRFVQVLDGGSQDVDRLVAVAVGGDPPGTQNPAPTTTPRWDVSAAPARCSDHGASSAPIRPHRPGPPDRRLRRGPASPWLRTA